MVETIVPRDEIHWKTLRTMDVTSTEVAALFGLSPYISLFELWHQKNNRTIVEFEEDDRMRWGRRLQDAIALGIAEDQEWSVRRMDEYMRDPELQLGSSFDFAIGDDGLLEIKNVDGLAFRDGWIVDGDDVEAPAHIELQVQHQLAVSGRKFAYLSAFVGGNRVVLIRREPDEVIIKEIRRRVGSFWLSIVMEQEPKPDFSRDAKFIARLYSYAEPNTVLLARGDEKLSSLMARYRELSAAERSAGERKDAIKAEILTIVGDHEKVVGDDFTLSMGVVGGGPVSYERKPYRLFKPSFRKG